MRRVLLFIAKILLLLIGSALLLGGGLCSLFSTTLVIGGLGRGRSGDFLSILPILGIALLVTLAGWGLFTFSLQLLKDERHAPPPFEPLPSEKAPDDQAGSER